MINYLKIAKGVISTGITELKMTSTSYSEIPHEIMHCLSLPHCFEENPSDMHWPYNYYKKASSDNYMDYQNTAKHTFHTQWRAMHVSKFTK